MACKSSPLGGETAQELCRCHVIISWLVARVHCPLQHSQLIQHCPLALPANLLFCENCGCERSACHLFPLHKRTDRWRGTEKLHAPCELTSTGRRQCECEIEKLITRISFVLSVDFTKEFKEGWPYDSGVAVYSGIMRAAQIKNWPQIMHTALQSLSETGFSNFIVRQTLDLLFHEEVVMHSLLVQFIEETLVTPYKLRVWKSLWLHFLMDFVLIAVKPIQKYL